MTEYVITKDNPYYPEVVYKNTFIGAMGQRDEWLSDIHEEDGTIECKIIIAEVVETTKFKSHY